MVELRCAYSTIPSVIAAPQTRKTPKQSGMRP